MPSLKIIAIAAAAGFSSLACAAPAQKLEARIKNPCLGAEDEWACQREYKNELGPVASIIHRSDDDASKDPKSVLDARIMNPCLGAPDFAACMKESFDESGLPKFGGILRRSEDDTSEDSEPTPDPARPCMYAVDVVACINSEPARIPGVPA